MSADENPKPEFVTNRVGQRVADGVNAHLRHLRTSLVRPPEVAIATAYFNLGGYGLLAEELDHPRVVRLLLGAEPENVSRIRALDEPRSAKRAEARRLRNALATHDEMLADERDLTGFTHESDRRAVRLIEWLGQSHVEVRRLTDRFLHGKAFITVTDHNEGVIAGSSNFTFAGLATNLELNLGHYQPSVVTSVKDWFDELWDAAEPYDLAKVYEERYEPHSPYLVYLRMLWERYGAELEREASVDTRGVVHLAGFQRDGLWRARRILEERRGVLIADEVGLGKTFLAGKLIEEAAIARRQRVLVIAPATLRDGPWRRFVSDFNLPVELRSYDELVNDARLNPDASDYTLSQEPDDYALVVIDEAHNVRNPDTHRAAALRRLLSGQYRKDLVLLTATPVNNSLWDLYYVLTLFLRNDAVFTDVGIPSMRGHFAEALSKGSEDLSPEYLFDILDSVAVRRTRAFVKRFYPTDTIRVAGREVPITFPTPRVRAVYYDLDRVLPGFFDFFAAALDVDDHSTVSVSSSAPALTLARYAPSRYTEDGADAREIQLAGLLRSGLLKRFESSPYAFARTCEKMAESHDAFLRLLDIGKVATGKALRQWVATDSDDPSEVDEYLSGYSGELEDADDYDVVTLRNDVEHDRELLRLFATRASGVSQEDDPTLSAVVDELAEIAAEAEAEGIGPTDTRDKRKVLIFSYFADTVEWVKSYLEAIVHADDRLACYRGRIASLTGSDTDKRDVLWGFAPRTTDSPTGDDKYDLVVTTDVLAEGVNLQQCRHIMNYDLPWNPMRLVQRHGRIDRIGSEHREVFLRCVFPDRRLDELLGLEERLHSKIKQAAAAVGVSEILPGSAAVDVTFAETREELEKLRAEDAGLFERGSVGRGALSGEEYRQELRQALESPETAEQIKGLPWGSGSGMAYRVVSGDAPGYVFCVRVADYERPVYRYVSRTAMGETVVEHDTLTCLDLARPADGWATRRRLTSDVYEGVFEAWKDACADIVSRWNAGADPANLAPSIPPAMRRAADVIRASANDFTVEEGDRLVEALEAPHGERIVRLFRRELATDSVTDRVAGITRLVRELGLEAPPAPEPMPEISSDDVNVICWLALTPQ
ncbi:helicase-related protein [Actinomycetospora sp. CA-053990]|uniref:helicase-related protein n=1 Tax=Actinomycetospora sp. CA-053990 TaxID=3239891 RepID=UPI003D90876E